MSEEHIRCPICGTPNPKDADACKLCKTLLKRNENGRLRVTSPKSSGNPFSMIDIEDPKTRKKLEELTLIPGVTRKKALYLYKSGIHSMEEFLQKALHGERYSVNYSRTVANKLLMQSLKGQEREQEIPCPSCNAPNPIGASKCGVCNYEIEKEMAAIDMDNISEQLSESVADMMNELGEDADFDALPDELKSQFAAVLDSDDVGLDMEKPVEMDALGIDLDEIDKMEEDSSMSDAPKTNELEAKTTEDKTVSEKHDQVQPGSDSDDNPDKAGKSASEPERKPTAKEEKIKKVLMGKVQQWRKAGYDVDGLEEYYTDVETFKEKAKQALEKGKVIKKRFEKQMEMWREKGFDVSELEPLLDKDLDAFQEKAKDVLKKQKK